MTSHISSLSGLFVTGTGTGVGKSFVTAALARALVARGEVVRALKPITSGVDSGPGEDALSLAQAAGHDPPDAITLRAALSPHRAARLEGRVLELEPVLAWIHQNAGPVTLVEGAGGWEVPCGSNWRIADLAAALGWPVVLVAPNQLGAINHTLLSVDAIRRRGLLVGAVVLSGGQDEASHYNLEDLEELLPGVPIVPCPWTGGDPTEQGRRILEAIGPR